MAKKIIWDRTLLIAALGLITIGIPMVLSSSALIAQRLGVSPYYFLIRQLIWTAFSIGVMIVLLFINYEKLNTKIVSYGSIGIALIMLVYVLLSPERIKRWIKIGSASFQPSEFSKIAVVLFLAYCVKKIELPIKARDAFIISMPVMVVIGLILMEPDLGTAFLIAFVLLTILFITGLEKKYILLLGLAGLVLVGFLIISAEYRKERVIAYVNQIFKQGSREDSLKTAFQLEQAKIAVGSGGVKGVGFGNSLQKLFYIPQPHNDFIFSIIAEELGLIGTLSIWILYFFVFIKGVLIAKNFPNRYGSYLAIGLVLMLIYQSLINVSVVLGLMPTKGIPLPFISCGGSSMLMSLASVGILLNLSQHARST